MLKSPRPTNVEWFVLALVLCLITWFGAGHALLGRIDQTFYDAGLALWQRPAPPNIVTVVVDEESLAAIGLDRTTLPADAIARARAPSP